MGPVICRADVSLTVRAGSVPRIGANFVFLFFPFFQGEGKVKIASM